jgi:hypothetical protein
MLECCDLGEVAGDMAGEEVAMSIRDFAGKKSSESLNNENEGLVRRR